MTLIKEGALSPFFVSYSNLKSAGLIPQNTHHRTVTLLFGKKAGVIFIVVLIPVYNDMLGRRDQAVLNAAVTSKRLLISARMEESYILRLFCQLRKEYGIRM